MKNYDKYHIEDFVGDPDFRDWVNGNHRLEKFWRSFLTKYPEKKEVINWAESIVRASNVKNQSLTDQEIRNEVERFITTASHRSSESFSFKRTRWIITAASIIIAVFTGWWIFFSNNHLTTFVKNDKDIISLVRTVNDTDKPIRVVMEDSSIILLSPKSSVGYPSEFKDKERKVYLNGEASFSVKHSTKPFMVYAGNMVTKVLGTTFVVRAFENDKKNWVQVMSGKVSVYSLKQEVSKTERKRSGLILTANQAAIFEKELNSMSKTLVNNPILITEHHKMISSNFDETPLPTIFHELEKNYGIGIQFDQEVYQSCKITANLTNETLYEKLDLLCKSVGANYEIVDGQITISGSGCQ